MEESLRYIERDAETKEVIISGGDPFMLSPDRLAYVLIRLSHIKKVKVLRLSTRLPVVYPDGLKESHIEAIKAVFPLWLIIHINHPKEITEGFIECTKRLRQANAILISQTVLMRGVNDCPHILLRLFEDLVGLGIKPYYLFQLDEVMGVAHFKVKIKRGIEIMRHLRRCASGLAVPHYMVDITGGAGKVPIDYRYIKGKKGNMLRLKGLLKDEDIYKDDGKDSLCLKCGLCKKETL
jgi:lysine 2,3-aminomutase